MWDFERDGFEQQRHYWGEKYDFGDFTFSLNIVSYLDLLDHSKRYYTIILMMLSPQYAYISLHMPRWSEKYDFGDLTLAERIKSDK